MVNDILKHTWGLSIITLTILILVAAPLYIAGQPIKFLLALAAFLSAYVLLGILINAITYLVIRNKKR